MPEQQSEGAQRPGCGDKPAAADEPPPSPRSALSHPIASSASAAAPATVSVRAEALLGPGLDVAWIQSNLGRAVARLAEDAGTTPGSRPARGRLPREIDVRIVGDGRMRELHARHCGLDVTTDVLTFPGEPDEHGVPSRVDIAVCRDEAARRADEAGRPVEPELLLYALHGVLHCLGYDDHEPGDYARMHQEEDRVLEAIGVGPVFQATGTEGVESAAPGVPEGPARSAVGSSPRGGRA